MITIKLNNQNNIKSLKDLMPKTSLTSINVVTKKNNTTIHLK